MDRSNHVDGDEIDNVFLAFYVHVNFVTNEVIDIKIKIMVVNYCDFLDQKIRLSKERIVVGFYYADVALDVDFNV